jgi:hypothetical protein
MKRAAASAAKVKRGGTAQVDAHLASLPANVRSGLEKLRKAILAAAPGAEQGGRAFHELPFTWTVRIVDDRGKEYSHRIQHWWHPERRPSLSRRTGVGAANLVTWISRIRI